MASQRRTRNRLLGALADSDLAALAVDLQPVELPKYQVVYEVGTPLDHLYFVESGLASVLTIMEDGASSEVGMIGAEGLIGATALLGGRVSAQHVVMQVGGNAQRISAAACRAVFDSSPGFRKVMLGFVEELLNLSSQIAACNRLHSIEQRTARWILMAIDRIGADLLPVTQEFLASALGVRRSGVSEAAAGMQRSGYLSYRRGMITIVDHLGLEKTACECYELAKQRGRCAQIFGNKL